MEAIKMGLAVIVCENLLLVHGLGLKQLFATKEQMTKLNQRVAKQLVMAMATFGFFCLLKTLPGLGVEFTLTKAAFLPLALFACELISLAALLVAKIFLKISNTFYSGLLQLLFDPLLMGVNLICIYREYSLLQGWAFILLSFIGYIFTAKITYAYMQDFKSKNIAPNFRGMPLLMLFWGGVSLACCGMWGKQIFN